MSVVMLRLKRTDTDDPDLHALVAMLDADLRERDGEDHYFFAQFNKLAGLLGVIIAYDSERAIGCGAFKAHTDDTAEIKRMFVRPEFRGRRIGADILTELESWAADSGFAACVLETGFKQPEAIALYRRSGYEVIPNYGQYADVGSSVCMRKSITSEHRGAEADKQDHADKGVRREKGSIDAA